MNIEELGRRAVACKHWKWMPGMYLLPHADGCPCCEDRNFPRKAARLPLVVATDVDVPDLTDPATLGCLLHLVREAWPDEWHAHVVPMWDGRDLWAVGCVSKQHGLALLATQDGMIVGLGSTEAGALVAALEAAPMSEEEWFEITGDDLMEWADTRSLDELPRRLLIKGSPRIQNPRDYVQLRRALDVQKKAAP
jgi:hypothetical protein